MAMQQRNNPLNRWFPWRRAHRDLMYWGARMTTLVIDLMTDLEANPPPAHTLGAHLMALRSSEGGERRRQQPGAGGRGGGGGCLAAVCDRLGGMEPRSSS
jgi:hypothetical protein